MKKRKRSKMLLIFIRRKKPNKPNIFRIRISKGLWLSKITKLKKMNLRTDYKNSKSEYRKQKLKNLEDKSMKLLERKYNVKLLKKKTS